MVKTILLSICVFLIPICTYPNIQVHSADSVSYEENAEFAVAVAESFVGIKEIGNNDGFDNPHFERMMKNVGWYKGAAWCAFALKLIYELAEIETTITGWSPTAYNKKNVIFTNGKMKGQIQPGDSGTLSYNKFKNVKSRYKGIGHAFIIKSHKGNAVVTLEGNTDSDASREGNGFYEKIRPLNSNLHITRWNKK
jgi:hypothetical protein